jgi:hypothetical protein
MSPASGLMYRVHMPLTVRPLADWQQAEVSGSGPSFPAAVVRRRFNPSTISGAYVPCHWRSLCAAACLAQARQLAAQDWTRAFRLRGRTSAAAQTGRSTSRESKRPRRPQSETFNCGWGRGVGRRRSSHPAALPNAATRLSLFLRVTTRVRAPVNSTVPYPKMCTTCGRLMHRRCHAWPIEPIPCY